MDFNRKQDPHDHFNMAVESFYLETVEGLFFAVKGLEHPPDRKIAVLRYVPDPERPDRIKDGTAYRRLYHFKEQEEYVGATCPQYRAYDPVFQATLQSVPQSMVRKVYDPRHRLQNMIRASAPERIKADAVAFTRLLREKADVPWSALGITGSLLIGLHKESSDLDIAVFGAQDGFRIHRALKGLLDSGAVPGLRRLDARGIELLYAERSADTRMDFVEFCRREKQKSNQGSFWGRGFFVRFIKEADEPGEHYGRWRYTPRGRATIKALIADDRNAIFTPCRYVLSDARGAGDAPLRDLDEIVSFRGRFCEQARTGQQVLASGTLERIQDSSGNIRHRLLLGNFPEDTMFVLQ
jgi:predicted nucleotidyltransferase